MALDNRVKELCKDKNMTLAEVAEKMDVSASSLSQILKGNPTLSKLQAIASALDVTVPELFVPAATNTITCPHCGAVLEIREKE
ncbi:helix-turn-helix domain-containing protein [Millionella massiliensis]|uniref:helix-turn-helix domain-containing protein n=1 Tax=Millionella massiliensis TaxID=1871023 RepID=UPI0008D91BB1|nr:helix-turn-helix transcriptional regulator [Millionella massiliensis]